MVKLDEQDKPLLDKLLADGTLVGYGAYTNLIHQEANPRTEAGSPQLPRATC
jgi:hypothetical protein